MGIPLTGNINSFQTKLKAKGFEVDKQINKYAPVLGTVKSRNSLKIKSCGISLLIFVPRLSPKLFLS